MSAKQPLVLRTDGRWAAEAVADEHAPYWVDEASAFAPTDAANLVRWANLVENLSWRVAVAYDQEGKLAQVTRLRMDGPRVLFISTITRSDRQRQGWASRVYDWLATQGVDLTPVSGIITTSAGAAFSQAYWSRHASSPVRQQG